MAANNKLRIKTAKPLADFSSFVMRILIKADRKWIRINS